MTNDNYFVFKGQKYYAGTIVELGPVAPYPFPYAKYAMYDPCSGLFSAMVSPNDFYKQWSMKLKEENIKRIVTPIDSRSKIEYVKAYKDTECDDMFYAWITYLAAMFFALFLNGRVIAWIIITAYFVSYRHDKLYMPKSVYEQQRKDGFL